MFEVCHVPAQKQQHPVFDRVTSGMDVVNWIGKTQTDRGDRPVNPVKMNSLEINGQKRKLYINVIA